MHFLDLVASVAVADNPVRTTRRHAMPPEGQLQFHGEEGNFSVSGIPLAAHIHAGPACGSQHDLSCENHSGKERVCLPLSPSIKGLKFTVCLCVHSVD
jgi:hypothetical protein